MSEWKKSDEKLLKKALGICEDARAQLVLRHPFVGRLGIQVPFIPVDDSRIHTIATNGKVIYIKPAWICSMPPVSVMAAIAHTIWTAALCHSFRRGEWDTGKFDLAGDLEVYTLLRLENVPKVRRPDFFEMFPKHLPVEEIAAKLPDGKYLRYADCDVHLYSAGVVSIPENLPDGAKKDENSAEKKQSADSDSNSGSTQSEFAYTAANSSENAENSDGKSIKGGENAENSGGKSSKDGENIPDGDEHHEADCSCDPAMKEVWRQRIIESAQNYKMVYGSLPGELEKLVEFFARSQTDQLQILRRYLSLCTGGESSWLPPARRFVWKKQYLPSRRDPALEFVVAVDTSASIDEENFQLFFSNIFNTVNRGNYRITLIQCDCAVQKVQEFSSSNPFSKNRPIEFAGGGGTDFRPVFEYVKNKHLQPKVLLYYTDGEGRAPAEAPPYPVLWLLTAERKMPWGKTIILN